MLTKNRSKTLNKDGSDPRNLTYTNGFGESKSKFAHKNSNQNLFSREVFIKYPHGTTHRRVLVKIQGAEDRPKQHPSIPVTGY